MDIVEHESDIDHRTSNMTFKKIISLQACAEPEPQQNGKELEPRIINSEGICRADCCCPSSIPKRYIFALVGFLASTLAIFLNVNLSLAIVAMVDRKNESLGQTRSSNECITIDQIALFEQPKEEQEIHGEFHWSPETEGLALAAVYYGQILGFLPGGRLAELYGGKKTLIGFLLLASVFTVIVPIAARLSIHLFVACRFLVGFGTGPVIPVLFYLISRWVPDSERSFNASFILAGYGVGSFLSFLTTGVLCASDFLGGWPSVFYLGGVLGFAWCLLCFLLVYETPVEHPNITLKELESITTNLGPTKQKQIENIPWKSIMMSLPFWSLAIGYFGQFWILGFYSTAHPLYMGTILNVDSVTNGQLSCLPPLIRGLIACVCGFPADWAVKKGYVGKAFIRKGATVINTVFTAAGFMAVILAGCDPTLNTIFFTVGDIFGDFVTFGVCMAGIDIAPNLSGTVSGILSILGAIPFFVIPSLIGWSTKYERSMAQWRYVYFASIVIILSTTLFYAIFGTSDPQSWGMHDEERPEIKENSDLKSDSKEAICFK